MPFFFEAAILSRMRSPVTSRSNWAKDSSTFKVSRPIDARPGPPPAYSCLAPGLGGGFPQAEETRARPMRTGDPPRDLGQGAVALAVILEAVIEDDDGVRASAPFAQQPRTGFEQQSRRKGAGSIRFGLLGQCPQPPLHRGSKPAMDPLLHLVGDFSNHKVAARRGHGLAAAQSSPRRPQLPC